MNGLIEKLQLSSLSLQFIVAEVTLSLAILLLVFSFCVNKEKRIFLSWLIAFIAIVISIFIQVGSLLAYKNPVLLFQGNLIQHAPALLFILLCDLGMAIGLILAYKKLKQDETVFVILCLAILLGCHFICLSANWLMFFISMELMAIPGYLLAAHQKEKRNYEAAIKYFVFGSLISALMLYGITWLYGITGSLNYYDTAFHEQMQLNQHAMVFIAICLLVAGFLFKINVAPAHAWSPDVYEGAPAPVVAILAVVPKIAATGALLFVFHNLQTQYGVRWSVLLAYLALFTLLVGNLGALKQKNARRMMAYSSIAQSGFLLIAILGFDTQNISTVLFYSLIFVIANYSVFLLIIQAENNGIYSLQEYSGLSKLNFRFIIPAGIGLIALAGLPPTAGFTAKFLVFAQLWEQYQIRPSSLWLALLIVGLLNTVIALFYYLKIPFFAFLKDSAATENKTAPSILGGNFPFLALVLALLLIGLFLFPTLLMGWLNSFNFAIR